ncbi:PIG-L family deacetylase [Cytophagaceae bacterium DM2B3-1]|uniref:PIG-L family deacetylase n=1 Tax=Xanthocytophaga flava TaxID=3048013 RepID=A0ABT7CQW6_9BACT|nr:PIG-L family deacetylase [Xanthocytophaga flavus]MDJ1496122.1 PIG-L family deacetylase [Xanthocytophaga flavus]
MYQSTTYTLHSRVFLGLFLFISLIGSAQPPKYYPAGEIKLALKKMNILGSALYMAAHPDDENTAMLAWLAKDRLVRTSYLAITRGDGGQNLIGSEQSELIGLIRTQELLQARRVDGAEQYFTRGNDFGFSKSTEEALQIWDKEKVLADVVWVIRNLKPDVIITRFPPTAQAGHGHHSASAVLAEEAFVAAADPKRYPEQLKYVQPWQVKRLVWNAFTPNFTNDPPPGGNYVMAPLGNYNNLLGKSYTEIAGESRSMHKSQGFGSARSRGQRNDYLQHKLGEQAQSDIFDGVDLSWKRVKGSETVAALLQKAYQTFDAENPAASVPSLLEAYRAMEKLPQQEYYVQQKKKELTEIIVACTGLSYEGNTVSYAGTPGQSIRFYANVVKRSDVPVLWKSVQLLNTPKDSTIGKELKNNEALNLPISLTIPKEIQYTQPYWLANPPAKGMYTVNDQLLIGKPEATPQLTAAFHFQIQGVDFTLNRPISYKWVDPVQGELYRPFEVRPAVMINLDEKSMVFPATEAKTLGVLLKAGAGAIKGELRLEVPKGWKVSPEKLSFDLAKAEAEQKVSFVITPPANASEGTLKAVAKLADGQEISLGLRTIDYDHIPVQTLFPVAQAKVIRLDVRTAGKNIAYLMGAGDDVPAALRQMGYSVTMLTANELKADVTEWQRFDAIVLGVRAFNTEERLKYYQPKLMQYVENGGVVLVQYIVNRGVVTDEIGPYPFELSRDRVTVEEATVTFLKPQHPLLNTPNKITAKDFEGWIQERGLYFAQKWDSRYEVLLSCADPGEKPQDGGLLVANYGKGRFIYTGYAFFRQLPGGVPGAYRLFANLLAPVNGSVK